MAWSERRGVIIGSVASSSLVGSTWTSSAASWTPEARAMEEASPLGLFEVLVLGSTLFVWVYHYLKSGSYSGNDMN